MSAAQTSLPLSGYTVLDLTRNRSGPTCVRQLADWGANVIKVEQPPQLDDDDSPFADRLGPDFQNLQRNRRSMTINLKSPEGVALFKKLAERADVIVENFRPKVKHRLGIDYESIKKVNPRIVYGSISGYGQEGPYEDRAGLDQAIQALSGLMSITGLPGQGPVRVGIAIGDSSAGIYCAFGVVMALLKRERTGEGSWVSSSMLQALIAMMDFQAARWLVAKEVPGQAGNDHPTGIPTGVYKTADDPISLAASGHLFPRLLKTIGRDELAKHPDYSSSKLRSQNRKALHEEIERETLKKPSAYWIDALANAGVPCAPINTIDKTFADPQVIKLGMAQPVEHPKLGRIELVGQGVRMGRDQVKIRNAAPERGEHTDEVLKEFGYTEGDIAALRAASAI
jgi:crotonobetainyl-CoA:carnitine CoA-transferase CaiB-like acyl-CoA transferase